MYSWTVLGTYLDVDPEANEDVALLDSEYATARPEVPFPLFTVLDNLRNTHLHRGGQISRGAVETTLERRASSRHKSGIPLLHLTCRWCVKSILNSPAC